MKVSNEEFEPEDFEWHRYRKEFDHENLNSNAITAFVDKKNMKSLKFLVPQMLKVKCQKQTLK